jgi:hypothetical protein
MRASYFVLHLFSTLCEHQLHARAVLDITRKADIGLIGITGPPSRLHG